MMYRDTQLDTNFGYINASWTLRADLTAEYACRVINHMDQLGVRQCTQTQKEDADMNLRPWIEDFSAGYMQRTMDLMPSRAKRPWRAELRLDKKIIRKAPLEDGALLFY